MAARKTRQTVVALVAGPLLLSGCKIPAINLATNEPIKVDIAMRLDVYQHKADGEGPSPTATPAPVRNSDRTPSERRKDREADIQTLKNSRLVGEGRDGLLVVLVELEGEKGDFVRQTVTRENSDRMAEMKEIAEKEKVSLEEVQRRQAELWVNRSFTGEWIEVKQPDGSYKWIQKQG